MVKVIVLYTTTILYVFISYAGPPVLLGFAEDAYSVIEGDNAIVCVAVLGGTIAVDITVSLHIETICK